ncbi:serine/threonine-protein kinase [Allocoleopsis sp.]|uniref:serine/threonine-protein kinase n=1 Tax=Allocoleopsis sp. TaxID=3088169 RepID=UPI002FCEF836
MAWLSGQRLQNGKYTVEKVLAEGSFGITYRAKDNNGQIFVIKTLNDDVQQRPDFVKLQQDFIHEVISFGACTHPHLLAIDSLFPEGTLWCVVMEYINGENLAHRVEKQGVLPESEALRYIQQIGEALTLIHNKGLLHREVKPQNIMLRPGKSEAVLIDFGITREFIPKTSTKILFDGFAPIEQYDTGAKRGAYTDVYALAATLYFLLTGKVPTIPHVRADGIFLELNANVSDEVNQAIFKGMELKAEDRPQSIQEWLALFRLTPLTLPLTMTSATGVDYSKLRDLLAAKKWQEADQETGERMLEVAGRQEAGFLSPYGDIDHFPCEDFCIIDQLWVKYSNARFGFSVQKRIWESVNRDWEKFCKRVGWINHNPEELLESELDFTLLAPIGHLPMLIGPGTGTFWVEGSGTMRDAVRESLEPEWTDEGDYECGWYDLYEDGDILGLVKECGL